MVDIFRQGCPWVKTRDAQLLLNLDRAHWGVKTMSRMSLSDAAARRWGKGVKRTNAQSDGV